MHALNPIFGALRAFDLDSKMHLASVTLFLGFGTLVHGSSGGAWCYTGCPQTPQLWSSIPDSFCGGNRQSPVDIVPGQVAAHDDLHNFTFVNFDHQDTIKYLQNHDHTVKLFLEDGAVEVSGGGLNGSYSALHIEFHWGGGNTALQPGSEHTVDGHRYPMEMQIVTVKKGLNMADAKMHPGGIAVLGFFINGTEDGNKLEPWDMLTSHVKDIRNTNVTLNGSLSIDDLTGKVDRTKFYRYKGSMTTPACNEVVIWTVFHEPIEIHKDLIAVFTTETGNTNNHRPTQQLNGRRVYASPATPLPPSPPWCYDSHCYYNQSMWHLLRNSHCGGQRQSPVNIETDKVEENSRLDEFVFTKFDDKHAIKYIINTGHAVKCVLKDNMVEVSGGGLGYVYSTLQFHFHWGSHDSDGSEHNVDSKRYPMEMHIVCKRKDLTLQEAIATPTGLAVLGFLIESEHTSKSGGGSSGHDDSTHPTSNSSPEMTPWKKLTSYLSAIQNISSQVNFTDKISIDDLLGKVNRKEYYRYNGSLTTPSCNEAVVWTVFKDTVKVDKDLMDMFPTYVHFHDVFRSTQPLHGRKIYKTASSAPPVPTGLQVLLLTCLVVGLLWSG